MRTIDADALDAKIYNEIPIKVFGTIQRMAAIREIIAQMPTIVSDKKEALMPYIGHGKNGPGPVRVRCGACQEPIDCFDAYCKHCGRAVKWDAYAPGQEKVVWHDPYEQEECGIQGADRLLDSSSAKGMRCTASSDEWMRLAFTTSQWLRVRRTDYVYHIEQD